MISRQIWADFHPGLIAPHMALGHRSRAALNFLHISSRICERTFWRDTRRRNRGVVGVHHRCDGVETKNTVCSWKSLKATLAAQRPNACHLYPLPQESCLIRRCSLIRVISGSLSFPPLNVDTCANEQGTLSLPYSTSDVPALQNVLFH